MKKYLSKGLKEKGFTLVELLVVIGVLTILLSIVLIAVNPSRQFSQANNTQRRSDVSAILNAINQYAADNNGDISTINGGAALPTGAANISDDGVDICDALVPTYIAEFPYDPTATGAGFTGCDNYNAQYSIHRDSSSNRITVVAPNAELSVTISVTR